MKGNLSRYVWVILALSNSSIQSVSTLVLDVLLELALGLSKKKKAHPDIHTLPCTYLHSHF